MSSGAISNSACVSSSDRRRCTLIDIHDIGQAGSEDQEARVADEQPFETERPGDWVGSIDSGAEITFRDLEIFLQFARTEHLGETADALGHSVALIQRAVRTLEQRLGVRLVERHGRRLRLLHAGRVLSDQAAVVLRSRSVAVDAVQHASGRKLTRLTIGHNFSLGLDLVPALVAAVLERDAELQIGLQSGTTNDLIAKLLSGHIDAVVVSPPPIEPDLEVIILPSEPSVLIVGASDPLAGRTSIDMAELRDRRFVTLLDEAGSRQTTLQTCARAGFAPRITIETGDMVAIEGIVAAGLAISIVPSRLARHGHPRIVGIRINAPAPTDRAIGLAFFREARARRSIALLREAATGMAEQSPIIVAPDATK